MRALRRDFFRQRMVPMPSGSKASTTRLPPMARAKLRYQRRVRLSSATPPPS
jgi:hypothetical protein